MNSRIVATALMLAIAPAAVSVRPAFAQTDDSTTKAARARFQEGVDFYDKGQYDNARTAFLQAYALRKHPAVLINLAQSSLRAGHSLEAARYFQQYLHESTALTGPQRADAEKGLAEARAKLGHIEVSAATGSEVMLDGEHAGTAPLTDPLDVEAGTHKVTVRAADGATETKQLGVTPGQLVSAKFTTQPTSTVAPVGAPPPPSPEPSPSPSVDTSPPATTPEATNADASPPSTDATPNEKAASSLPMAPVWIGVGVGAAGFLTAIIFGISKSDSQSKATSVATAIVAAGGTQGTCVNPTSRFQAACSTLTSDNNSTNADALVANIGIGVGIAGGAFALAWYFLARKHAPRHVASPMESPIRPLVGPHFGGLSLGSSF